MLEEGKVHEVRGLRAVLRFLRRSALTGGVVLSCGVITLAVGCGEGDKKTAAKGEHHAGDGHKAGEAGHGHAEEGPHKGHLIELGKEEYHGEILHDEAAHKITIYLLDKEAKKSVPIADKEVSINVVVDGKPSQFKLPAAAQSGDPAGQASKFELVDHALCEALDDPKAKGRFNVTIGGKAYSGDIEHHEEEKK